MKEIENLIDDYFMDEFGRVIIKNEAILEFINGAGALELFANFANKACGSNGACGNAGCENLRC